MKCTKWKGNSFCCFLWIASSGIWANLPPAQLAALDIFIVTVSGKVERFIRTLWWCFTRSSKTLLLHRVELQLWNSATVGCGLEILSGFFTCWAGLDHILPANGSTAATAARETNFLEGRNLQQAPNLKCWGVKFQFGLKSPFSAVCR